MMRWTPVGMPCCGLRQTLSGSSPFSITSSAFNVFSTHFTISIVCTYSSAGYSRAMASNLPIPIPPRTPTPPPDEPVPSPTDVSHEQNVSRLSPLVDTFPPPRSPVDVGSRNLLSPTKSISGPSPVEAAQSGSSDDGSGPFNFNTVSMAKSPVVKSVRYWSLFGAWDMDY